jgi:predicted permease
MFFILNESFSKSWKRRKFNNFLRFSNVMANSLVVSVILLYAYILGGYLVGLLLGASRNSFQTQFTKIMINWVTPFQIFFIFTTSSFPLDFWFIFQIILVASATYAVLTYGSTWFFRSRGHSPGLIGAGFLLAGFPNAIYYALPIILSAFGEEYALIPVIFASTMLVIKSTLLPNQADKILHQTPTDMKTKLKKILFFPPFLGILISVIFLGLNISVPLDLFIAIKNPLNTMATVGGAGLIGMIIVNLNWDLIKKYVRPLAEVALWRFLGAFLLYMSVAFFLQFSMGSQEIKTILLIIVCGPPAMNNVIFSLYFHFDDNFTAVAVATLTLFGLLLLPLWLFLGPLFF